MRRFEIRGHTTGENSPQLTGEAARRPVNRTVISLESPRGFAGQRSNDATIPCRSHDGNADGARRELAGGLAGRGGVRLPALGLRL